MGAWVFFGSTDEEIKKENMEKQKCKSYFGDYKCHVATNIKDSKGRTVYVDKCLKEAVENLNAQDFNTVASCCGHGIVQPKITIENLDAPKKSELCLVCNERPVVEPLWCCRECIIEHNKKANEKEATENKSTTQRLEKS